MLKFTINGIMTKRKPAGSYCALGGGNNWWGGVKNGCIGGKEGGLVGLG
jgi:hypothetical protein